MPLTRCVLVFAPLISLSALVELTPRSGLSLTVQALTFQCKSCLHVCIGLALWDTEDAAHADARALWNNLLSHERVAVRHGEGVPTSIFPHTLGLRCLPRLRRSTVSGQLLVSFCSGQHPRSDQTLPDDQAVKTPNQKNASRAAPRGEFQIQQHLPKL